MGLVKAIFQKNWVMSMRFRSFSTNRCGVVAIEFAIILPLLLLMTLPVYDYFRYILMLQKVNKTASTIADMIVMSQPAPAGTNNGDPIITSNGFILTEARLANIMGTADFLMQPFNFVTNGGGYVNAVSVFRPAGQSPGIYWSYSYRDTWKAFDPACTPATAHTGVCSRANQNPSGDPANYMGTFFDSMVEGENAIVVAACMNYEPVFNFNAFILPVLGVSIPSPQAKILAAGNVCTADMVTATRVYPARNGPLIQIYTP